MKAVIGVPTGRGVIRAETMLSLFETNGVLRRNGYSPDWLSIAFAEPAMARNFLAHEFLKREADLLIMQDDDVAVSTNIVQRMLDLGKEFTGVYLPQRKLDFAVYSDNLREGMPSRQAQLKANPPIGEPMETDNAIVRTGPISAGFLMLRRAVFARIDDGVGALEFIQRLPGGEYRLKGYFNNIQNEQTGRFISEDISFCERYLNSGGEIFAYKGPGITHYGAIGFHS
jgi:hypothetical protein